MKKKYLGSLVVFYLTISVLTFIDKLGVINNYDLGLNLEYWGDNTTYLSTIIYWFNIFMLSLLLPIVIKLELKDKVLLYCSLSIPAYWLLHLFRAIIETGWRQIAPWPDLNIVFYTVLVSSFFIGWIRFAYLKRVLNIDKFVDKLITKILPSISSLAEQGDLLMGDPMNDDQDKVWAGSVMGKARLKQIKKKTDEAQEEAKKL